MPWSLEGRYDSTAENRRVQLERDGTLEISIMELGGDVLASITIPTWDIGTFRDMVVAACKT